MSHFSETTDESIDPFERIKAKVIGEKIASYIDAGKSGIVHSVFDKAINVSIDGDTDLITILSDGTDINSVALITSMKNSSWNQIITKGETIILADNAVFYGAKPLVTGLNNAVIWQKANKHTIRKLPKLSSNEAESIANQVFDFLERQSFPITVFPKKKLPDLDVKEYLGNGLGLTPSGDDFLEGMITAIYFCQLLYIRKIIYFRRITNDTEEFMHTKTNRISSHFLRHAINGDWSRSTERFLFSFFRNDFSGLYASIYEKKKYGATSGIDEIQGMLFGLQETISLLEKEESDVYYS